MSLFVILRSNVQFDNLHVEDHSSYSHEGVCNEPLDEAKEIDEADELEPELEEYFEDFYESSGGSYSPFPSEIFALLFFLVHSPYPIVCLLQLCLSFVRKVVLCFKLLG